MRIVNVGTRNFTEVVCHDGPGQGNACHKYEVRAVPPEGATISEDQVYAKVNFQNGPVREFGVNGCHNEDLIAIVIDRLNGFQAGDFACRDNEMALIKLEEGLMWLRKRTNERVLRGVEGTNVK